MATKSFLRASVGSLSDTLAFRFDPAFPTEVSSRWLGVMGNVSIAMRRTTAWNALPEESEDYDAAVAEIDSATRALVLAANSEQRLAALGDTDNAVDGLNAILDQA
jgi:hypothetical protein